MQRLALLTLDDRTGWVIDDPLAVEELGRRGFRVDEVPWRRSDVDWRVYDGVIIRTTWDYQRDLVTFLARLGEIERLGVPLANSRALVEWNARKTYLRDLAARGAAIVPTCWGRGLSEAELRKLPGEMGVRECVLKPVVSANADDTFRITADMADAQSIAARFAGREWMAQPFVESVLTEGEASLFYFGGEWSHAVRKRPKAGDFRVQEEHGGTIEALVPDAQTRAAADRVMAALGDAPLQARIDLVRLEDGSLALMEMEAIEPSLYFRMHPDASRRYADAVEKWLAKRA